MLARILLRVDPCWNFGQLILETLRGYRDELQTPGSYLLGAHLGHKTCQKYECLRPVKSVLLVTVALLSDLLQGK